jgi:hypothetical protein
MRFLMNIICFELIPFSEKLLHLCDPSDSTVRSKRTVVPEYQELMVTDYQEIIHFEEKPRSLLAAYCTN